MMLVFRGMEGTNIHPSRISEFGALEQSLGFRVEDAMNLSRSMLLAFRSLFLTPFCFGVNLFCYLFICYESSINLFTCILFSRSSV